MKNNNSKFIRITENTKAVRDGSFNKAAGKFIFPLVNTVYSLCNQKISTIFKKSYNFYSYSKRLDSNISIVNPNSCNIFIQPTATPGITPTTTLTVTPTTPTVTPTATPNVTPTATPTVTPTATPTVTPTATPTVTPTATPTVTPTATPTVTPTATPTVTPTATPGVTPTVTSTPTPNIGNNSANYNQQANWNGTTTGNVTTVGSNGGPSFYGTYDQSGNVWDWTETVASNVQSSRRMRGGGWSFVTGVTSVSGGSGEPSVEGGDIGFRLSSLLNPLNLSYFVNVGDVGNSNDPNTGNLYGDVNYIYQIAQYPVTNCEYVQFLNAVASTDTYGLYNTAMDINARGGITRSGSSGSYTYTVKTNMGNKPVVLVSWFDCARYCNWLHNGKPTGPQNSSTTEDGAYTLNGATTGVDITRNVNANYYIPTENEWYKAAYYKGGGTNTGYWLHATQSDTLPTPVNASSVGDGLINGEPANVSDYVCLIDNF